MRREVLKNNSGTELAEALDNSETGVDVVDGSVFPSEGDFRILVDSEIMLVTARSSNTLTVTRGAEGTAAAIHSSAAAVTLILTEDALEAYGRDSNPWHNAAPPLRILLPSGAVGVAADFTWFNQESSTRSDSAGAIILKSALSTTQDIRGLVVSVPAAPWTMTAAIQSFHLTGHAAGFFPQVGIGMHDGTKVQLLGRQWTQANGDAGSKIGVEKYTGANNFSTAAYSDNWCIPDRPLWLRIQDDNTDFNFLISPNGIDWYEIFSETRNTFLTPTHVGFFVNQALNNTQQVWGILQHLSFA